MFICYFPLLNKMLYFVSLQKQYHNINPLVILPNTATSYIFEMRSELTGAFREENIRKIKDSFVIALVVGLLEVACPALLSSLFLKRWVLGGIYDTVYRIIVAFRSQCNKRRKSKTVAAEGVRLFSKKKKTFLLLQNCHSSTHRGAVSQAGSLMVSGVEVFGHSAGPESRSITCLHI